MRHKSTTDLTRKQRALFKCAFRLTYLISNGYISHQHNLNLNPAIKCLIANGYISHDHILNLKPVIILRQPETAGPAKRSTRLEDRLMTGQARA